MGVLIVIGIIIFLVFFNFSKRESPELTGNEIVFKSSFTRGTDVTAPEMLIFSDKILTWRKNRGAGWFYAYSDSVSIPYRNIVGVRIHSKMVGSDIEIIGAGYQSIYARKFKDKDVKKIESMILNFIR